MNLSTKFLKAKMADMEPNERVQSFLDDSNGPRHPQFSQPTVTSPSSNSGAEKYPDFHYYPPRVARSDSKSSTPSSADKYSSGDSSFGRKDSLSSAATSFIEEVPGQPTWPQQHHYDYGYDLPCEFLFLGCELRFHPLDSEDWISHSVSHFVDKPVPRKAICTFCDSKQAIFRSHGDANRNWRERMLHIRQHFENREFTEHMRPDFHVIDHMQSNKLISLEDYHHALKASERPPCQNMYPLNYQTPEMVQAQEKSLQQPYDLGKEQRQMERMSKNGKGSHNKSFRSHRTRHNPQEGKR